MDLVAERRKPSGEFKTHTHRRARALQLQTQRFRREEHLQCSLLALTAFIDAVKLTTVGKELCLSFIPATNNVRHCKQLQFRE